MSGRTARSLVGLGVAVTTAWAVQRVVLWWVVLQVRRVGPDPLLPAED